MIETQPQPDDLTSQRREGLVALADDMLAECSPHQAGVLGLLAVGHLHEFNPWESIDRLGFELPVRKRLKFRFFAESLAEHDDLISAIDDNLTVFPASVNAGLKLANETGQLGSLMHSITERRQLQATEVVSVSSSTWFRGLRTLVLLHTLVGVMTFISLFIVPQFVQMMDEFGLGYPPVLEFLMQVMDVFSALIVPVLASLLVVAIIFALPLFRRLVRRLTPSRWRQRLSDRVTMNQRMLAAGAELTGSLRDSVLGLADVLPAGKLQRRVERASEAVSDGQNVGKTLGTTKLLRSIPAKAVTATESADTQAWLLRAMSDRRDQRTETRWSRVFQILIAITYTVLGLMVAITAIGVFSVLLSIINGLTG